MKNNKVLLTTTLIGMVVILTLATIWHFIYGWFPSIPMALIAPVNESPWEHIKMFFAPAIIWYIIEYIIVGKRYKNYIFAHGMSLVLMPIVMFAMFYGYRDLLKIPERLSYDIVVTTIAIILGSLFAYRWTIKRKHYDKYNKVTPIIVLVLFTSYAILTYFQPKWPLFYDRHFDGYGINTEGHDHSHDEDHEDEEHEEHEDEEHDDHDEE